MGAIVALCLWAGAQAAGAETLPEAMADAAQSNPTLAAQRERLRATREALPQAWSQALPQLSISAGAGVSQSHGAGASPQQDTFNGSATASPLLVASGGVLASTRQARAQIAGALADYDGARQQLLLDVASAYAGV
ncbi:MAG: TolC family protein, partial [Hyphomonadaceae bacterium]